MFGVCFIEVFNTKIVDSKGKREWFGGVAPKTRSVRDWSVAEGGKVSSELIVCEDGCLFQAIHAFADFDIGVSLGVEVGGGKFVLFLDVLRDVPAVNPHVLVYCHVANKKKIFQVGGAITGASVGIGDDAVPVKFSVDETHSRGANVLIGVEEIATNGHSDTPLFSFTGAVGTDKLGVGNFSAGRNLVRENEKHGVIAADLFTDGAIEM